MPDQTRSSFRDLVHFYVGGGWGEEELSDEFCEPAYVIRGTDFAEAQMARIHSVPRRFHKPLNLQKRVLQPGDICLEVSGGSDDQPVGRVLYVDEEILGSFDGPAMCASFCKLLRADAAKVEPFYLYWILEFVYATGIVERYQVQSTGIRNFQFEYFLDDFAVHLPEPAVQQKVSSLLGALREQVRENRRQIEIVEQMVRLIYREWFVNFRFSPESMELVDSALGSIPKGWRLTNLAEHTTVKRSSVRPMDDPEEEFEHYSIPAFDDRGLPIRQAGSEIKSGKYLVESPSVLLSKLNPRFPRVWRVREPQSRRRAVCSTEFMAFTEPGDWPLEFVYAVVSDGDFGGRLAGMAGGTSTSHQRAKPNDVTTLPLVEPPNQLVQQFVTRVGPMLSLADELVVTNAVLRQAGDLLLPRLIAGEFDESALAQAFDSGA